MEKIKQFCDNALGQLDYAVGQVNSLTQQIQQASQSADIPFKSRTRAPTSIADVLESLQIPKNQLRIMSELQQEALRENEIATENEYQLLCLRCKLENRQPPERPTVAKPTPITEGVLIDTVDMFTGQLTQLQQYFTALTAEQDENQNVIIQLHQKLYQQFVAAGEAQNNQQSAAQTEQLTTAFKQQQQSFEKRESEYKSQIAQLIEQNKALNKSLEEQNNQFQTKQLAQTEQLEEQTKMNEELNQQLAEALEMVEQQQTDFEQFREDSEKTLGDMQKQLAETIKQLDGQEKVDFQKQMEVAQSVIVLKKQCLADVQKGQELLQTSKMFKALYENELVQQQENYDLLEQQIKSLTLDTQKIKMSQGQTTTAIQKVQDAFKDMVKEKPEDDHVAKMKELQEQLQTVEADALQWKSQYEALNIAQVQVKADSSMLTERLKRREQDIEATNQQLYKVSTTLEQTKRANEEELRKVNTQLTQLKNSEQNLQSETQRTKAELKLTQDLKQQLDDFNVQKQKQIQQLSQDLAAKEADHLGVISEASKLRIKLKDAQETAQEQADTIDAHKKKISRLEEQLEEETDKLMKQRQTLAESEKQRAELDTKHQLATEGCEQLQRQNGEMQERIKIQDEKMVSIISQQQESNNYQIQLLKEKIAAEQQKSDHKLTGLNDQLKKQADQHQQLNRDTQQLRQQLVDKKLYVDRLEAELFELREQSKLITTKTQMLQSTQYQNEAANELKLAKTEFAARQRQSAEKILKLEAALQKARQELQQQGKNIPQNVATTQQIAASQPKLNEDKHQMIIQRYQQGVAVKDKEILELKQKIDKLEQKTAEKSKPMVIPLPCPVKLVQTEPCVTQTQFGSQLDYDVCLFNALRYIFNGEYLQARSEKTEQLKQLNGVKSILEKAFQDNAPKELALLFIVSVSMLYCNSDKRNELKATQRYLLAKLGDEQLHPGINVNKSDLLQIDNSFRLGSVSGWEVEERLQILKILEKNRLDEKQRNQTSADTQ